MFLQDRPIDLGRRRGCFWLLFLQHALVQPVHSKPSTSSLFFLPRSGVHPHTYRKIHTVTALCAAKESSKRRVQEENTSDSELMDNMDDVENAVDNDDTNSKSVGISEYSFFDEAIIVVRAGSGGAGASTFKKGVRGQNGPADGGNGGRGGNVILVVDPSLNTLAGLNNYAWRPNAFGGSGAAVSKTVVQDRPKHFRAENGAPGGRQFRRGQYGTNVEIRLPPGTVVQEQTEEEVDGQKQVRLADIASLTVDNPMLVVARGGEGGEGSSAAVGGRGVRRPRIPQEGGERKTLKLTLKIVADVALVGVPNAGKSTLLAAVTRAKPKIANYPFTTVIPNLGVWVAPDSVYQSESDGGGGSNGLVLCDVPGLIEGAARGVGLGHAFLRHVERCHVILHLVDATSEDPLEDFRMINSEIVKYGTGQLAKMPQVVVVNKIDAMEKDDESEAARTDNMVSRTDLEQMLRKEMAHTRLMWMSAKEREGVDDLMSRLDLFVKKVKQASSKML